MELECNFLFVFARNSGLRGW